MNNTHFFHFILNEEEYAYIYIESTLEKNILRKIVKKAFKQAFVRSGQEDETLLFDFFEENLQKYNKIQKFTIIYDELKYIVLSVKD